MLKKTLNELKGIHFSIQHLSVKATRLADIDERAFLLTSIGSQISRKVVFDENVNKWLGERDVSREEIESLLRIPKSLRSHTSRSHQSGRSSTSSARRAQAVAKEEVAGLKLAYLKQKQELEQQQIESKLRREQEAAELEWRRVQEEVELKQRREQEESENSRKQPLQLSRLLYAS